MVSLCQEHTLDTQYILIFSLEIFGKFKLFISQGGKNIFLIISLFERTAAPPLELERVALLRLIGLTKTPSCFISKKEMIFQ